MKHKGHEFYETLPLTAKRRLFDDDKNTVDSDKIIQSSKKISDLSFFDTLSIVQKCSDKNVAEFVIKARREGIDLMALGKQIGISPKDATLKDYTLMYNVSKEIMRKYGFQQMEIYQSRFFTEAMKSRLSEIEDYEKKRGNFSEEERIELSDEDARQKALGTIAYETGKEMLFEARKLIETVERGDLSVDQLGDISAMLQEAKFLMQRISNEEMKSWDNDKRFEELMKTIKKDNPNRDGRDEQ